MSDFFTVTDGLVSQQSSVALPPSATDLLINFIPNELGKLVKRSGTRVLPFSAGAKLYSKTISDVEVIIAIEDTDIVVYDTLANVLYTLSNVYRADFTPDYLLVDADVSGYFSVIIFANNCNPVQLFFTTYLYNHPATTATVSLDLPDFVPARTYAFRGNTRLPATFDNALDVTLPANERGRVTLMILGWSAWAPASYYSGEEFGRLSVRDDTQVTQVPEVLVTELPLDGTVVTFPYLEDGTPYTTTQQPVTTDQVAYSEGQTYEYSLSQTLAYSPFFWTFGVGVFESTFALSIEDVDPNADKLEYVAHSMRNGTKVQFKLAAPGGIAVDTDYYVVNAVQDSFQVSATVNGSPVDITSVYDTTRNAGSFRSSDILADGSVSGTLSIGSTPQAYRLYSNAALPAGLVSGELYWLTDNANIRFYTDSNGEVQIKLSRFRVLSYTSSDVNTGNDRVTITGHGLFNAQPIAFILAPTPPAPCVAGTVYYVKVVDANTIELYYDVDLTNKIDLSSAGSGGYITESYGPYTLTPEYPQGYIEIQNNFSVLTTRMRALPFAGPLRVLVNDVVYTRTEVPAVNSYYVKGSNNAIVPVAISPTAGDYISFESLPDKTPQRTATVKILSTAVASAMHPTFTYGNAYNDQYALSGVVTAYGYQQHFTFNTQPTAGALVQSRLALCSGTNIILSSATDSYIRYEYFNNFDISDRLTGTASEPFQVVVGDRSYIVKVVDYQNSLFVFTREAIFRLRGLTYDNYVVEKIAEHGILTASAVAEVDSLLVYANASGVYVITLQAQETYGTQEISNNVADLLQRNKVQHLVFDDTSELLYYFAVEGTYAYSLRAKTWTKFQHVWQPNVVDVLILDDCVTVVDSAVDFVYCYDYWVQYDLLRETTITDSDEVAYSNRQLRLNGALLESAIVYTDFTNVIPFAENILRDGELVPLGQVSYDYVVGKFTLIPATFTERVFDVLYGTTPSVLSYGYAVPAVFLSSSIRTGQLSFNSRVIYVEVVLNVRNDRADDCIIGMVYGNDNKPSVFHNAVTAQNIPPDASFVIVKEAIQGVSSTYRVLVVSPGIEVCDVAGFGFVSKPARSSFISGGV